MIQGEATVRCRLTICVEMQSDWHIGSGGGRHGSIDRLVDRDADGLPFIPAKTITGIWRDACERLAAALDEDRPQQNWAAWVRHLFGSQPALAAGAILDAPMPAAVSVRSAHLPVSLRAHLVGPGEDRNSLRAALTFVRPGVAIDEATGRTRTDFLRFEEVVRAGAVLEAAGEVRLTGTADQRDAALSLLLASAGLVERLGGKRRRGTGRCGWAIALNASRPEIGVSDPAGAVQWLADNHDKSIEAPIARGARRQHDRLSAEAQPAGEWWSVPMRIHLLGPIAVARATLGNLVESLDYVPGTLLLALVVEAVSRSGIDGEAAIRDGLLRVLPATPEIDGRRGLPLPLAVRTSDDVGRGNAEKCIYINRFAGEEAGDRKAKTPDRCYVSPVWPAVENGSTVLPTMVQVATVVRTHNSVEDAVQRPTEATGGVYSYEAIAARQVLRCELRLRRAALDALTSKCEAWWRDLLCGEHRLGRSGKDDYGRVTIESEPPRPLATTTADRGWERCDSARLTVWSTSDALLRDPCLRPTTGIEALRRALAHALGVALDPLPAERGGIVGGKELGVRRIESWQRAWKLPRPSLISIAGGSCAVFQAAAPIDPVRLAQVEAEGIGERRAEGFGCVLFNHPLLAAELSGLGARRDAGGAGSGVAPPTLIESNDPVFAFARETEAAAWRSLILEAALALAADVNRREEMLGWKIDAERCESSPTMSQLAGLRQLVAGLEGPEPALRSASLKALRAANADAKNGFAAGWPAEARDRLHVLFCNDDTVWRRLAIDDRLPPPVTRPRDETQAGLRTEAQRLLVEACIRAHKRDVERCQRGNEAPVEVRAL